MLQECSRRLIAPRRAVMKGDAKRARCFRQRIRILNETLDRLVFLSHRGANDVGPRPQRPLVAFSLRQNQLSFYSPVPGTRPEAEIEGAVQEGANCLREHVPSRAKAV